MVKQIAAYYGESLEGDARSDAFFAEQEKHDLPELVAVTRLKMGNRTRVTKHYCKDALRAYLDTYTQAVIEHG